VSGRITLARGRVEARYEPWLEQVGTRVRDELLSHENELLTQRLLDKVRAEVARKLHFEIDWSLRHGTRDPAVTPPSLDLRLVDPWTVELDLVDPIPAPPPLELAPALNLDDLLTPAPDPGPGEPRWRKGCPASVALFATDGRGAAVLIDHQGPDVAYLVDVDERSFVDDELSEWRFPGLWVWEGRVRSSRSYEGEHDEWCDATIRPLTEDEAEAVRTGDHVWDGALWREDWKP